MPLFSEETLKLITENYLLANTPTYLFKRLRSLSSIQNQVEKLTTQTIIERLDALISSVESSEELMEIYGLLVLLSHKYEPSASAALKRYSGQSQDWIGEVSKLAQGVRIPMSSAFIPSNKISRNLLTYDVSSRASSTEVRRDERSDSQERGGQDD